MKTTFRNIKTNHLVVAIFLTAIPFSASPQTVATNDPPKVWINGTSIFYSGATTRNGSIRLEEIVKNSQNNDGISRLVINSGGGDTVAARKIGRQVRALDLDVEVRGGCFSSCANYVFPAGKAKIIAEDAFVGWHGTEAQYDYMARQQDGESGDDLRRRALGAAITEAIQLEQTTGNEQSLSLEPTSIANEVAAQMALGAQSLRDEQRYFEDLGLTDTFANLGHFPGCADRFAKSNKPGWTFPIKVMRRLGLGNVVYAGQSLYEQTPAVRDNLFIFENGTDCLSG